MPISPSPFSLRNLLLVDALSSAAMGVLLALGSTAISDLTRIPPALLLYAGFGLLPVTAFMTIVATRAAVSPAAVRLIIAGNALWVAASLLLLVTPWIEPNGLGSVFIAGQALVVAVLTGLEHRALRQQAFRLRTT
jgi:hypothetical protein